MKKIIFALSLILSFSSLAAPDPACSLKGTTVIYINGVNTSLDEALDAMLKIEELGNSQVNQKFNTKIDSKNLSYRRAYNYSGGLAKDILESVVQRLPKSYLEALRVSNLYAAYSQFLEGKMIQSIATSIINSIVEKKLELYANFASNYSDLPNYGISLISIREKYISAFEKGKRIFSISHSQGSLFMNDIFDLLPDNNNKKKYFTGFQVASVLPTEMNTRFGYATHSRDMAVNIVRDEIGALAANLDTPLIISNAGFDSDFITNHGMVTTYLYDSTLKSGVISKLIETANKQVSNCFYANIDYTKNKLQVKFDSRDPQDRNPDGLTYVWSFGDGLTATTEEEFFTHSYSKAGTYDVTLTVKDGTGASETATIQINLTSLSTEVCNYLPISLTFTGGPDYNSGAEKDAALLDCGNFSCGEIKLKVAFCNSNTGSINNGCWYPEYGFVMSGSVLFLAVEMSLATQTKYMLICTTPKDSSGVIQDYTLVNSNKYLQENGDIESATVRGRR